MAEQYRDRKTGTVWTSQGRLYQPWGGFYQTHLLSPGGRKRLLNDHQLEKQFELVEDA